MSELYSDNGTNFIGAKSVLNDLHKLVNIAEYNTVLQIDLTNRGTTWKMIPPSAPHFGALWEFNIKYVKTHIYKVTS